MIAQTLRLSKYVNQQTVPVMLAASLLAGCDQTSLSSQSDTQIGSQQPTSQHAGESIGTLHALIPTMLRNIDIPELTVTVSIDNTQQTLSSSDFAGEVWELELPLIPNETYPISLEWYSGTHLLLEEKGELFTDLDSNLIQPDLEFTSGGFPRFDADCDGFSNLDEILRGTNLAVAQGTDLSACVTVPPELDESNSAWIIKQFRAFDSNGFEDQAFVYQQNLLIKNTNPNLRSHHTISIIGDGEFESAVKLLIQFINEPGVGRRVRMNASEAINGERVDVVGASCFVSGEDDLGVICVRPVDWQEDEWYQVRFYEISVDRWQVSIASNSDTEELIIGTIDFPANTLWKRSQVSLIYHNDVSAEVCRLGVSPLSIRFTQGIVNETHVLEPGSLVLSDCAKAGPGSGEGVRTINQELVYDLKLGEAN